jgi:hypothetical protein
MRRCVISALAALTLIAASCSGDGTTTTTAETTTTQGSSESSTSTTTAESPVTLEATAPGVTEDSIHLGFVGIDFDTLRELGLVDINRGSYELIVAAFVDDLNARGGINGRKVIPHVEEVSPVDLVAADTACLRLTEDLEVFAVLGELVGPTSTANNCFTRDHDTIMVGAAPTPRERAEASAPWIATGVGASLHLPAALHLMANANLFGDAVGVAWNETEARNAEQLVLPTLEDLGIDVVDTFVQGTHGGDAVAGEAEWQTFSEVIQTRGIDTMVMLESTATFGTQQLIANGFEGQFLVVDTTAVTGSIGTSHIVELEQLERIIGTSWLDSPEAWEQEITQDCIAIFEAANPEITVIRSDLVAAGEPNWSVTIGPLCNRFRIFEMAAHNAGANLTQDTFLTGVEQIGAFELVGQGAGLLEPGKYDASNAIRLVEFDVDDLPDGGQKPFGPMVNLSDLDIE